MGGESILTNSWDILLLFKTTLDHPPSKKTLDNHKTHVASDTRFESWSKTSSKPEVGSWEDDDQASETTPHPMGVLHVEDLFKAIQCEVTMDTEWEEGEEKERERERERENINNTTDDTITNTTHCLNSGNCLYLSNSASHSTSERGGFIPFIRCHCVIERPDSVSLVTPPTRTAPPINPQHPISHHPTARPPATPPTELAEVANSLLE